MNLTDGTPIIKLITTTSGWARSLAYGTYKVDNEERPGWVGIETDRTRSPLVSPQRDKMGCFWKCEIGTDMRL